MTCPTKMINDITVRFIRPENAKATANPIDDVVKISNVGYNRYRIAHKTVDGHQANSIVSGNSVFRWFRRAINNMTVDDDAYAFIQIDWILFPAILVSRDNLKQNDVYSSILDSVEFHLDNWPGAEDDEDNRSDCCDGDNVIAEFYFNYPFDYSEEVPEIDEDTASEADSDVSDDSDATEEVSPVRRSKRIAKKAPVAYSDSDSDSESEADSEYTESEDEDVAPTPTRRSKRLAQKPHVVYSEISDDEGNVADAANIRVHTFYGKGGKEVSRRVYNLRGRN